MSHFVSFPEICAGNLVLENEDNLSGFFVFDSAQAHGNNESVEVNKNMKRHTRYSFFLTPAKMQLQVEK